MDYKKLADFIFPDITKTIEDYEKEYPERPEGTVVTRYAPSPTGFMHIGNFYSVVIDYVIAKRSNGVFFLRNEDTDQAREIDGAVEYIMHVLKHYGLDPDEYEIKGGETKGNYGPYIQSERKDIYKCFIKYLISEGKAYPCFLTAEELEVIRDNQSKAKMRIGIYGKFAKYRDLPVDEAIEKIKAGEQFVIRLKSPGNFNHQFVFNDLANGEMKLHEDDIDTIIYKSSTELPTYHFAHLVDDHLMRTTNVVRGQEWMASIPVHYNLFNTFGYKMPKYIHTPLILKKDGDTIRKISKRLDPEARMTFYEEKGYPQYAVIESIMTIANSNYEAWREGHPDAKFTEFEFSAKKMSPSGALYDLDKLDNISKNYISRLTKDEVFDMLDTYTKEYDKEFNEIINKDVDYTKAILNIEREQKKPRKDYAKWEDVKPAISYMFDELFNPTYTWDKINNIDEIKSILDKYINNYYNENDDKETWFEHVKELTESLEGYTSNMKEYKENPDAFKGNVADVSTVIRIALTGKNMTPDLYEIMKLLGKDRIDERINNIK
ncbi:MAG: glutamate--tRNA ligase [Bacilli bacterium]|nr:glutamate--tRNA ligase [Bacilli bacterium]